MSNDQQHNPIAFGAAAIGIGTYSAMDVVMKGLALELGTFNAMFWRSLIAIVLAGALYLWKQSPWPSKRVLRLHIWRGAVISVMAFLFFWGLKFLPVAEAIGLSFIAPLIALYLAAVVLQERIQKQALWASLIGMLGALIVIGGRLSGDYTPDMLRGIAAILCSAILYAYNLILQRQQALVAEPIEIGFFQNATIVALFGCLSPFLAVLPPVDAIPQLATAATLGLVSLLTMSWAYARAPANTLIPVEYTAFGWAALLGWLGFGEMVTLTTVIGTALIVTGCLIATWRRSGPVQHVESTAT